ncbi:MAG: hypothetical protein AUH86_21315 [Acidobacteria bacterium 13_1_40CM_4_58_4]|nr:MAG: hypothetical protein AUH86_21315 [Acidobacteria bacterium 13_1_40CM_4_58_4]
MVCLNGAQYLLSVLCRGRMEVDEQRNLIFADIDEVNADDVVVCTQNLDAVNCRAILISIRESIACALTSLTVIAVPNQRVNA